MKYKRGKRKVIVGYIVFFMVIAVSITAATLIYMKIEGSPMRVVVTVMLCVIALLSFLCTVADAVRRKHSVQVPVDNITEATDRIAAGDFSVRLAVRQNRRAFSEFDCISENINKMAEALSRNEVLKKDFISNVSHELKTPLSVIQNYAMLIKSPDIDDGTRAEYADTLVSAAKRLSDLVVNILKLNKLEQGEAPEFESVSLSEMLENAVLQYEDAIERKNIDVDCDIDEVRVTSSRSYLEIVFNNIISNAVKFTPDGGKISVSVKSDGERAEVRVSDTGCGMSEQTCARIFDKFYQGDTSHAQEGNGLGLALVKKVIDILGGEISVTSAQGVGSTFVVRLKTQP